ncbi:hypothetical protein EMCRGX_G029040 [Ephydatia muelleri]
MEWPDNIECVTERWCCLCQPYPQGYSDVIYVHQLAGNCCMDQRTSSQCQHPQLISNLAKCEKFSRRAIHHSHRSE